METGSAESNLKTSKGGKQEGNLQKKKGYTEENCGGIKESGSYPHIRIEK